MVTTNRWIATSGRKPGIELLLRLALIALLASGLACDRRSEGPGTTEQERLVHPLLDAIPGVSSSSDVAIRNRGSGSIRDDLPITRALLAATASMTLGVLEGDKHQMFGNIVDIKVDDDNNLYVLDSQYSEVRVYRADGTYLYAIGKAGQGPDEFAAPEGLEVDPDGRVFVADRYNGVKVFARSGEMHELVETVPLPFEPQDICVRGNVIHIQASTAEDHSAIFRFTHSGDALDSFGFAYNARSEMVRDIFTDGQIVCMQQPSTVLYFPSRLPVAFGYSYAGQLRWITKETDFASLPVTEVIESSGRVITSMNVENHTFDQVLSTVPLPTDQLIVQIAHFTPESVKAGGDRVAEVRTYVMSAHDGEAVFVGKSLPHVYTATRTRLYTARHFPFPQITVYEFARPIEISSV